MGFQVKRYVSFFSMCVLFINLLLSSDYVNRQEPVKLQYSFSGNYRLTERSDWSQYINGRYIGLTSREVRGFLHPDGSDKDGIPYSGNFYILQQTKRNNVNSAHGIDEIQPASFVMSQDGSIKYKTVSYYPQLRNFPVFPEEKVTSGKRWQAVAERVVDPKNNKQYTVLEIPVEYEFVGEETYNGQQVYRIKAKYATRFNIYNPPVVFDPELKNATGTHDVSILVSAETGAVIMILDRLDETFIYKNGETIRYRGSTTLFTEIPVQIESKDLYERAVVVAGNTNSQNKVSAGKPEGSGSVPKESGFFSDTVQSGVNRDTLIADAAAIAGSAEIQQNNRQPAFEVENTDKGVRLSVRNLQFIADSAQLLPGEEDRLDAVAEVLKSVPDGMFLIEGHTASVGRPDGEQELSVERAQSVLDELVQRGLKADQFIIAGYGGTRPVADNSTENGRAINRRVEITILE